MEHLGCTLYILISWLCTLHMLVVSGASDINCVLNWEAMRNSLNNNFYCFVNSSIADPDLPSGSGSGSSISSKSGSGSRVLMTKDWKKIQLWKINLFSIRLVSNPITCTSTFLYLFALHFVILCSRPFGPDVLSRVEDGFLSSFIKMKIYLGAGNPEFIYLDYTKPPTSSPPPPTTPSRKGMARFSIKK